MSHRAQPEPQLGTPCNCWEPLTLQTGGRRVTLRQEGWLGVQPRQSGQDRVGLLQQETGNRLASARPGTWEGGLSQKEHQHLASQEGRCFLSLILTNAPFSLIVRAGAQCGFDGHQQAES